MYSSESKHAVWAHPKPNKKQPKAITPVIAMRNLGYARIVFQSYGRAKWSERVAPFTRI
jgi:hypothetical protein